MNNHLTLPGLHVSRHFVSGLVDSSCWVRRSVNKSRMVFGEWLYVGKRVFIFEYEKWLFMDM